MYYLKYEMATMVPLRSSAFLPRGLYFLQESRYNVRSEDFEEKHILGIEGFGKVTLVRKCRGRDCGRLFAMKEIAKCGSKRPAHKIAASVAQERDVMIKLGSCCPFLPTLHYAFQTQTSFCLVLDYASKGDLFDLMEQLGLLELGLAVFYMAELLLAVQHLHSLGILHRDIKPENILIAADGHIILGDFGLVKIFPSGSQVIEAIAAIVGLIAAIVALYTACNSCRKKANDPEKEQRIESIRIVRSTYI